MNKQMDDTPYANTGDFWARHRSTISSLYPSESYFFTPAAKVASRFLDLGCATGEFLEVISEIKGSTAFDYFGIDISPTLLAHGTRRRERGIFICYDGFHIPLKSEQIELAFSFGVLHHVDAWQKIVDEMLRVAWSQVIFDLRVTTFPEVNNIVASYQEIGGSHNITEKRRIKYVVNNFGEVCNYLYNCAERYRCAVDVFGYRTKPTEQSFTPFEQVTAISVRIAKNKEGPLFSSKLV